MVYDSTLSEYQRVMQWQLNIEEFGPNFQYVARVDNIVAYMISIFPSTSQDKYDPCTRKAWCSTN